VHGANRLASNSLLESLVFAWRAVDALGAPWPETEPLDTIAVEEGEAFARADLQSLMWRSAGLFRTATVLDDAESRLASWGSPVSTGIAALEDRNLLDLSRMVVRAALERRESRGAHYRDDFPEPRDAYARHSLTVREAAPLRKESDHALV
jgi:L-aspartate oxidase